MIIKITVNDNDFTDLIEHFASDLHLNCLHIDTTSKSPLEERRLIKALNNRIQLLNPNVYETWTKEQQKGICQLVAEAFDTYINNRVVSGKLEQSTADYLRKNFKVSTQKSVSDRWENGKVVYYFQHSNSYITQ